MMSGDIYVGLFWAEASKNMTWLDLINFKLSLEQPNKVENFVTWCVWHHNLQD